MVELCVDTLVSEHCGSVVVIQGWIDVVEEYREI